MQRFAKALTTFAPLFFVALALVAPGADKNDPAFAKWWTRFQMAVARRDVKTIALGVQYPLDWEVNSEIRAIRSESDLSANFGLFFTPEVVKNIVAGKPEKLPNGNYLVVWKARGNEYSLNIRSYGGAFALDSLGEGPP
jgi:hypothetical protein